MIRQSATGMRASKGMRALTPVVLDRLAAGLPTDELLKSYPSLTSDDVQASLEYATAEK